MFVGVPAVQVRIVVTFRGREQSHMDLGNVLLDKVTNDLEVRDSRCCFLLVNASC